MKPDGIGIMIAVVVAVHLNVLMFFWAISANNDGAVLTTAASALICGCVAQLIFADLRKRSRSDG